MIAKVWPLLRTLLDIIALRKGPDAIPYSWGLTGVVVSLWLTVSFVVVLINGGGDEGSFLRGTALSAIALIIYSAIVILMQRQARLLQTLTAVLGCGAVISAVYGGVVLLTPLLGEAGSALLALLVVFWSVPVEGHIMARAIDRSWYVGIVIATLVFSLQLYVQFSIFQPS
jgi:hypothetical protein